MDFGSTEPFVFDEQLTSRAFVYFSRTPTRKIMITLTDLEHKVVFCCTSGVLEGTKRFSRSTLAMEQLFRSVDVFLKFYKITGISLILRMRLGGHIKTFLSACRSSGVEVIRFMERFNVPHNGVRSRRAPRK